MSSPVLIITGASRGLGAACAIDCTRAGARTVLNARSREQLQQVADQIEALGGETRLVTGDITEEPIRQQLVRQALSDFGRLDGLVNNAGVIEPIAPVADGDPQAWAENLAVNLLAPAALTRLAAEPLRASRGRVVNVSSGAAVNVVAGWGAYCASKAALNHLTRVLAEEEPQITALAFRPGVVDTAMQAAIREQGARGMPAETHRKFLNYFAEDALLPPQVPGRALAALALRAPPDWNGAFLAWDDPQVKALTSQVFPP